MKFKIAWFLVKKNGLKALFANLNYRIFGKSKLYTHASSVDFRRANIPIADSEFDFINKLLPQEDANDIANALATARKKLSEYVFDERELEFPTKWNSGTGLQTILCALVILSKPQLVIETGTANGYSSRAIGIGLSFNKLGKLYSFDVIKTRATWLDSRINQYVELMLTDKHSYSLKEYLKTLEIADKRSIFFHDSDHSYINQSDEYELAIKSNFSLLISDDVDSTLAFTELENQNKVVYFDKNKFIGGVNLEK